MPVMQDIEQRVEVFGFVYSEHLPHPQRLMDYYNNNAKAFVESTLHVNMQPLYSYFLPLLPDKANILDLGCGSGRDSKAFLEQGYQVTAMDACLRIAALAEVVIGHEVLVERAQDMTFLRQFDGIWACASLLHIPLAELPGVFVRLARALTPCGVIYCSFKYGMGEHHRKGRHFTDMDEVSFERLIQENPYLQIQKYWVTVDRRPERKQQSWFNGILVRSG